MGKGANSLALTHELVISSLGDSTASEAKKLKEAKLQAEARYEQMLLDLKALSTATEGFNGNNAEDHVIAKGMKSRATWKGQRSKISKKVIEIKAQAELHDLSELMGKINNTEKQLLSLHTHIQATTLVIKAADTNQGLYTNRATKA